VIDLYLFIDKSRIRNNVIRGWIPPQIFRGKCFSVNESDFKLESDWKCLYTNYILDRYCRIQETNWRNS